MVSIEEDFITKIIKNEIRERKKKNKIEAASLVTTYNSRSSEKDEDCTLSLNEFIKKTKKKETVNKVAVDVLTLSPKLSTVGNTESSEKNVGAMHTEKSYSGFWSNGHKKSFEQLTDVNEYKAQVHVPNAGPYFCRFCNQKFKLISSLTVHESCHVGNSNFECLVCSVTFGSIHALYKHFNTHSKKKHECDMCEKKYMFKPSLVEHYRIHTGERPFACDVCDSRFMRKGSLKIHYRKHTGERPYSCNVCDSRFMQSFDLVVHYRKHTGQRPYTCNTCHNTFSSWANRMVHERIHSGYRPYDCTICGLSFNQSHVLTEHVRLHTGEKPYECGLCEQSFVSSGGLRKHTLRKHNKL